MVAQVRQACAADARQHAHAASLRGSGEGRSLGQQRVRRRAAPYTLPLPAAQRAGHSQLRTRSGGRGEQRVRVGALEGEGADARQQRGPLRGRPAALSRRDRSGSARRGCALLDAGHVRVQLPQVKYPPNKSMYGVL